MYKFLKSLFSLIAIVLIFAGCRKKAFDEYYGRPENLAPPIYQVLQSKGNFTSLLTCIDRSGYKDVLSSGGYWTLFAPNDAAFQKYFTANNTSLSKIDSVLARKIVAYCLVYNAYKTDHIADYQSAAGWVPVNAYKRRTAYYTGFQFGEGPDGAKGVFVAENRNAGSYVFGDNNNKYIPYFYSTYMSAKGLSAADYNYFFPNSTYSGFNVVNASVVNKDILAENGVIHEIDQVVLPLPSIEQKLASNDQYSVFKGLLEQYMVSFVKDANYARQYNTLTRNTNDVYVKTYSPSLAYALGNESYNKLEDNDGQREGYTLFAPTNTALNNYLNTVILEFYKNVSALPTSILSDLLNAHMFPVTVWPTKFSKTNNSAGEPARFDSGNDVVDKQFCSNGIFYGVNKVQQANVFSTVYARSYLDPAYSLMNRLYDATSLKNIVTNPGSRYAVFMLSDATLRSLGFDYNTSTSAFTQTVNGVTTSGATPLALLQRIMNINIVPMPNGELNDLSGDGIAESNGGEYIRWHNNTVSSGATVEKNLTLRVVDSRNYSNGKVYFLSGGILDAPTNTLVADIAANAGTATSPYYDFYQYLINSAAYNAGTNDLIGAQLGGNYTIFVPTQAAMKQAVVDGWLPGTTTVVNGVKTFSSFNYKPTASQDRDLVVRFIYAHILNGITVAPDGKKGGGTLGTSFPTMLKDALGNPVNVTIFNQPNNLKVEDGQARFATVLPPNNASYFPATSNYLGNRALLHQIDNYLRYNY